MRSLRTSRRLIGPRLRGMSRTLAAFWVSVLSIWLGAQAAEAHHPAAESHVLCAIHGQVEDVPTFSEAAAPARASITETHAERPDHHACALLGAPGAAAAWVAPTWSPAPPLPPPSAVPLVPTTAPRPPPLAYAPKTSPPSFS